MYIIWKCNRNDCCASKKRCRFITCFFILKHSFLDYLITVALICYANMPIFYDNKYNFQLYQFVKLLYVFQGIIEITAINFHILIIHILNINTNNMYNYNRKRPYVKQSYDLIRSRHSPLLSFLLPNVLLPFAWFCIGWLILSWHNHADVCWIGCTVSWN